jgi:hypothetical protein
MDRRWLRAGPAVALLGILGPSSIYGQYRPPEPAPTPQEPVSTPAAPAKPAAAIYTEFRPERTAGWEPLFVAEGVYEQNVGFTTPSGPDDSFGSIQASLTRWRRTERGEVRLTLDGAGYLYGQVQSQNRVDGGVAFRVRSQMTRRVRGSLSGRFTYGHSDTYRWLVDNAAVLPLVRTLAGDVGGDLAWRLGKHTDLSFAGAWRRVDFDSDALVDTELWTASTSLSQRISERESLSLSGQLMRVEEGASTRLEPRASFGFMSRLSKGVSLDLSAGAGRSETIAGVEAEPLGWTAHVAAGVSAVMKRSFVSLRYEHGLRPTPGLGVTELTDLFSLGAVMPVGGRLEVMVDGSFALREDRREARLARTREGDVFAGAALRLARRLRLVLGYRFRYRYSALQDQTIRNNRGSVSLTWGPASLVGSPGSP